MTMVAACHFSDGAVVVADSRITWKTGAKNIFGDMAQKTFPIAPKTALSFAGEVRLATIITKKIVAEINKDKRSRIPTVISSHLPRVAKFCFQEYIKKVKRECSVAFILSGVNYDGKVNVWVCESPSFILRMVGKNPVVIGSGNVVRPFLQEKHHELITKDLSLKEKADILLRELEAELKRHGVDSVGGLFQTILLSKEGIAPLSYGFFEINPNGGGQAKEIRFEQGKWIQKDLTTGLDIQLLSPGAILKSAPINKKFYDYDIPIDSNKQKPQWYLNYMMTLLKVNRDFEVTEFEGVMAEVGSYRFPREIPMLVSIGVWGSVGTHKIEFYLCQNEKKDLIHSSFLELQYMPEQNEFDFPLKFSVQGPGVVFLECYIGDQFLGRRSLYFGLLEQPKINNQEEFIQYQQMVNSELITNHKLCSDSELSQKKCFLEYLMLCEGFEIVDGKYRFIREPKSVYWKTYPLQYKIKIMAGLRLQKREQKVTIDLVNVMNQKRTELAHVLVNPSSECLVVPIEGDLIVPVPAAGVYFFNLYLENKLIGSTVLAFETDKPNYSYSLRDSDMETVKKGELLVLLKRSQQAPKN